MNAGFGIEGWESLALATRSTAAALRHAGGNISETKHLQPEARKAVAALAGWRSDAAESRPDTTSWCHSPGGLDLVAHDPQGRRWIGELKLRKTDELLWDLLKLADSARQADVVGAFLLVGARTDLAKSEERCTELVAGELVRHPTLDLFEANREAWTWVLEGGTARPLLVPKRVTVLRRESAQINLDEHNSELALISVEGEWSETIAFDPEWWAGDWPVGIEPTDRYLSWRLRHCEFLRELDATGGLDSGAASALAKEGLKLNLNRDTALNHRCSRLITSAAPRLPTDAGRAFVDRWLNPLRDALDGTRS